MTARRAPFGALAAFVSNAARALLVRARARKIDR